MLHRIPTRSFSHYHKVSYATKNLIDKCPNPVPSSIYQQAVSNSIIQHDTKQQSVSNQLDTLFSQITNQTGPTPIDYTPSKTSFYIVNHRIFTKSDFDKWFKSDEKSLRKRGDKQTVYELEVEKDFDEDNPIPDPAIHGMYLYGEVGSGKTYLMDIFYECVTKFIKSQPQPETQSSSALSSLFSTPESPEPTWKIHRTHFHDFMLEVHQELHKVSELKKQKNLETQAMYSKILPKFAINLISETQNPDTCIYNPFDLIPPIASKLVEKHNILCFDEFQVTDISDAMILRRLFTELWKQGCIIVTTGNRPIEDLYKNGLQYKNFAPFLPVLKQHNLEINISEGLTEAEQIDYRNLYAKNKKETFFVGQEEASQKFHQLLFDITGQKNLDNFQPTTLSVFGRDVPLSQTFGKIAYCSFQDLCAKPLGSSDYITIANHFKLIFLYGMNEIDLQTRRSEARRLISLIDTCYDRKIGVVFLSSCQEIDLFMIKNWDNTGMSDEERLFLEQFYDGFRQVDDDIYQSGKITKGDLKEDENKIIKENGDVVYRTKTESDRKKSDYIFTSGEDEKFAIARLLSRIGGGLEKWL